MDFEKLEDIIRDKSLSDQDVAEKLDSIFIEADKNGDVCQESELDELWQIGELLRRERPVASEIFKNMQITEDRCSRCMVDPGNHDNHIGK